MKKVLLVFTSLAILVGCSDLANVKASKEVSLSAAQSSFKDLKKGHWAESVVKQAVEKKYITGYEDGTFRPNNQVTRAEFAAMLSRAIPKEGSPVEERFSDISDSFWGKESIEKGIELGFIDSADYQKNQFHPSQPMTRAELSKWMAKGLIAMNGEYGQVVQTLANSPSTLIPIPEFYKGGVQKADLPYIGVAMGTGLLNGYEDATFRPNATTTRAEVAAILMRLVNVMEKQPSSFKGLNELVEVAETGTNMTTATDLEYLDNNTFANIIGQPITFNNNYVVARVKRFIFIPAKTIDEANVSIYGKMFIGKDSRLPKTGTKGILYFSEIEFTPNEDGFNPLRLAQSTTKPLLMTQRITSKEKINSFGLETQPNENGRNYFKIGVKRTMWSQYGITTDSWYSIETDAHKQVSIAVKTIK